jgi:hypothetical protein
MGHRSQEQRTGASLEQRIDAAKARQKALQEEEARQNALLATALLEHAAKRRKELAEAKAKTPWIKGQMWRAAESSYGTG